MEPRHIILQSCSTNSLINNKYQPYYKEANNKTGTPLRHKNYEFFSPNNPSPLRFAETHLPNRNNKNKSNHSMNFSSTLNEDNHKRLMAFCDFKQNMSNNSPKPIMSKKLIYNKEKSIFQSQNRLLTEPRAQQILLVDHEPCNFEENPTFTSSGKVNFASSRVGLQNSTKNKANKLKVTEENRMFSNLIKKDPKHKRRHSQSSIAQSQMQEGVQFLRCKNNDGKKAKYRVVSKESIEQELCYCSNCTIILVQQGFILQKIPEEQAIFKITQNSKDNLRQLYAEQLQNTQKTHVELQRKQLQTLNEINKFYNEIIDILSQYQLEDIKMTENYFGKLFNSVEERKLLLSQHLLREMMEDQSLKELISHNLTNQLQNLHLGINSQTINQFKNNFSKLFRPKIQQTKHSVNQNSSSYFSADSESSFNNQMRFSFQDPLKFNTINKGQKVKNKGQRGKDQGSKIRKMSRNQKKDAFRDLFPQDQGPSVNAEISSPTFKQF